MAAGIFHRTSKGNTRLQPEANLLAPPGSSVGPETDKNIIKTIYQEILFDISQYSSRSLTNGDDILDAFKGVMQIYRARAGNSIKFLLGLPIALIPGLDVNSAAAFVLSSWYSSKESSRRHHFPSWSWTGWTSQNNWLWHYGEDIYSISWYGRAYYLYSPEINVLPENGDKSMEAKIEKALDETLSYDKFAILRIVKPYIFHEKDSIFLKEVTEKFLSDNESTWEQLSAANEIAVLLMHCDINGFRDNRFLILKKKGKTRDEIEL